MISPEKLMRITWLISLAKCILILQTKMIHSYFLIKNINIDIETKT